ncbi:MAG TPA: hypothetical protein PK308_02310 [Phycisphaerales bacterium]|nr:hypothetical protein [Phycisphaerales bacterium]
MSLRTLSLASLAGLATLTFSAADAHAITIATFADPTAGPTPSLFQWNATTQTLTGGYTNPGLTLRTPGLPVGDFADAKFLLPALVSTGGAFGAFTFGPGSIQFFDSAMSPIFLIEFDSAVLSGSLSFGASDFVGFNVRFSGSILPSPVEGEAFAFSFANPVTTATGFEVTSSFTSSADRFIPAPGAMALVGVAGLVIARRRRA